jgi:hypothetical protein
MAERDEFDRALQGVFEHRAREFSSELRALLEELWLEGVRQGRRLERLELRPGLERPAVPRALDGFSSPGLFERGLELTLEDVARAARELRARGVRQPALELPGLEDLLERELENPWYGRYGGRRDVRHLAARADGDLVGYR